MAVLLCRGSGGLMVWDGTWRRLSCPLPVPTLLAARDGVTALADNTQRLVWMGDALFPVAGGVEALRLWQGKLLVLSGEADSLTLYDAQGMPLYLAPAGVYPQDMCLLPGDMVAVCGGGEGVLLLRLPGLQVIRRLPVPGHAQRITGRGSLLHVLCAVEEGCLLGRIDLRSGRYEALRLLPGLPGALHTDGIGRLWAAAGERLYGFWPGTYTPRHTLGGFGLIRSIDSQSHRLLLSDPVQGALKLLHSPFQPPQVLHIGEVGQAAFL
ncbi:MAG: hypothetical protein ACI4MJ_12495 [Aristaeellaceae bacterium]